LVLILALPKNTIAVKGEEVHLLFSEATAASALLQIKPDFIPYFLRELIGQKKTAVIAKGQPAVVEKQVSAWR
jgi:hypothetical protein